VPGYISTPDNSNNSQLATDLTRITYFETLFYPLIHTFKDKYFCHVNLISESK